MATQKLTLTTSWQLVTDTGFIAQCPQYKVVQLTNADSTPSAGAIPHGITDDVNLQISAPDSGNWYARVTKVDPNTDTTLIFTPVA